MRTLRLAEKRSVAAMLCLAEAFNLAEALCVAKGARHRDPAGRAQVHARSLAGRVRDPISSTAALQSHAAKQRHVVRVGAVVKSHKAVRVLAEERSHVAGRIFEEGHSRMTCRVMQSCGCLSHTKVQSSELC